MKGLKISNSGLAEFVSAVQAIYVSEGSDKTTTHAGEWPGHAYQRTYASQFMRLYARHLLGKPVRVAEVGVHHGSSMRAMRRILPFAEVYGFDMVPCPDNVAGATVVLGDGYAAETWKDVPSDFDLIIDDGSHSVDDMLRGLPVFTSHLRWGGVLLIEDIPGGLAAAGRVADRLADAEIVDTRDEGQPFDDVTVLWVKK